jgi:hypothetical protein
MSDAGLRLSCAEGDYSRLPACLVLSAAAMGRACDTVPGGAPAESPPDARVGDLHPRVGVLLCHRDPVPDGLRPCR